ncbi:hypothetical protein D3C73_278380 [compost metagenome]
MAHYECRYCDRPSGYMGIPITVGSEQICACGAEWEDAKILVTEDNEECVINYGLDNWEDGYEDDFNETWYQEEDSEF